MLTKVALGLAIAVTAVSGALAATHRHAVSSGQGVYNATGAYIGTDPDARIRFELNRDSERANSN